MYEALAILGALALVYGAIAKRVELLSVLLHGVTAQPWARAFGARSGQSEVES